MAYRIEYKTDAKKSLKTYRTGFIIFITICVLLFALAVNERAILYQFLFPGDDGTAQTAIINFMTDLHEGTSVTAAFTAFCETIVEDALEQK